MDAEPVETASPSGATGALSFSFAAAGVDAPQPTREGAPGLEQQAMVVGSHRWVERKLFEILGAWVADEPSDPARVLFDLHSKQHAWHSELFGERLPVLDWIDPDALTRAPSPQAERALELAGGAGSTLLRLVGAGRFLLPRLVSGYTLHLKLATAVADAPLRRALGMVVRDEIEAWQASELMLESAVRDRDAVEAAARHFASLEGAVAGSGPGFLPREISRSTCKRGLTPPLH